MPTPAFAANPPAFVIARRPAQPPTKQSRHVNDDGKSGLLRRFAPRNDEERTPLVMTQSERVSLVVAMRSERLSPATARGEILTRASTA